MRMPRWRILRTFMSPDPWFAFLITCALCALHWVLSCFVRAQHEEAELRGPDFLQLPQPLLANRGALPQPSPSHHRKTSDMSPSSTMCDLRTYADESIYSWATEAPEHMRKQENEIAAIHASLRPRKPFPFAIGKSLTGSWEVM